MCQFLHSRFCERFIYFQDRSAFFAEQGNKWIDRGNIWIAHKHMNVEIGTEGRAIPFRGIHKSKFLISALQDWTVQVYCHNTIGAAMPQKCKNFDLPVVCSTVFSSGRCSSSSTRCNPVQSAESGGTLATLIQRPEYEFLNF
jgi:hypothetical protein